MMMNINYINIYLEKENRMINSELSGSPDPRSIRSLIFLEHLTNYIVAKVTKSQRISFFCKRKAEGH